LIRPALFPAVLLAAAVLLAGCDQADPAAACKVEVDTAELQQQREAAGIADCEPGDGAADLPDVVLPCLGSDSEASLADVGGPAVINFWASNCGPCRKEMPALQEFHETYGDQVTVLGVDYLETYPAAALELAAKSGTTYPSLADPCGDLQQTELVIAGLPQFVFVAEDGSIERDAGGVESVEEIVEMTEQHLDIDLVERGGRR
jgi:thiol-disulfide isomerase/thioredoxin